MKPIYLKEYLIAGLTGFFIGLRLLGPTLGVFYLLAAGACTFFAFRNNVKVVFTILPYLVYTEMFMRTGTGGSYVPYLFIEYLMIALFIIMLFNKKGELKIHSRSAILILLYTVIEFLDVIRAADITYARSMVTNSVLLTFVAIWASSNAINSKTTSHIIKHLTLASVYLCGNILVAHFTHQISYSLVSSSEATNRMAPVQVSGFLGVGSSLLFLYLMNDTNKKRFFSHLGMFAISVTLMILSFSRGGIYFLSSVIALFAIFNWREIQRFGILLLLLPVGYIIYYYATNATDGKIEQRYSAEGGASTREDLVKAGFTIFMDEPLAGVGTGNYGKEIKDRDLYGVESGAHNEFVRAAAEHGLFGILFYWGFYIVILFEVLSRKKAQRELALYFLALYCLIIVHNGLKTAVQPYLLVIIIATPTMVAKKKREYVSTEVYLSGAA
jgi:O-antigen ligase